MAAPHSSLRFYSSQKPTPLPASLVDTHTPSPGQSTVLAGEEPVDDQRELSDDATWDTLPNELQLAYRPPPKLRRAQRPDQISDPEYVPATTSDELEAIGGLENWWNRRENWPKTSDFQGFKTHRKIHDQHLLELVVRRAVIEASVLSMVGREHELMAAWPVQNSLDAIERCLKLDIEVANGRAVIIGDVMAVAKDLTLTPAGAAVALDAEGAGSVEVYTNAEDQSIKLPNAEQAAEYVEKWSSKWKDVSLTDLRMKFAVRKRIFQLTGQLIPDHQFPDIKSVKTLLAILQKPEKPKTLSMEILKTKQELVELPNVAFVPKRVTRGDKAKALGQFKLIEAEFAKRDIQNVHAVSSKEKSWFKGEA